MSIVHNIRRSFQNVKKDVADVKNQSSKLAVDISALTARIQKLETEHEEMNKEIAKAAKKKK